MSQRKFSDQELIRRQKLDKLIATGKNPYDIDGFQRTHTAIAFKQAYENKDAETLTIDKTILKMVGRVRNIRQVGKVTFLQVQDGSGSFQAYLRFDELGDNYQIVTDLDLGDIVGVHGSVMLTKTKQLTIHASKIVLLSKALKVLPSKFHGLKNTEDRYRQRYLDLIFNPDVKAIFVLRHQLIRKIQSILDKAGYIEVETPILQEIHGGAAARPFITYHHGLKNNFYLRIATELHLKRLIIGGIEKVYEIGRIFRNEGIDTTHNPEFTSIEIYTAYDNMLRTMDLCENLIKNCVGLVNADRMIRYRGHDLDFSKPFARVKMTDLIKKYLHHDFDQPIPFPQACIIAKEHNLDIPEHFNSTGQVINFLFEELIQPQIIQPMFVYEYPVEVSPLSKSTVKRPGYVDRFELFIVGEEYANAFAELNDPIEQEKRFLQQTAQQAAGDEEAHRMDYNFIEALEYGLPPTGGIGIGIDRLIMLLTNQTAIRNVILFPTLKPKK